MKYLAILALSFQLAMSPAITHAAGVAEEDELVTMDEAINQADKIFEDIGVGKDYSPAGFAKLVEFVAEEDTHYSELEKGAKLRRKTKPFLKYAEQVLAQASTPQEQYKAYYVVKRLLYSTFTLDMDRTLARFEYAVDRDPVVDENGVNWKRGLLSGVSRLAGRLLGGEDSAAKRLKQLKRMWIPSLNVKIPSPSVRPEVAVGAEQAALEAKFLVNPNDHDAPVDLSKLTVEQIADLDLANSHPAWYSQAGLRKIDEWAKTNSKGQSPMAYRWTYLEKWAEDRISKKLTEENNSPVSYEIAKARRVMFVDAIFQSATSPKVGAEDAYGQDWKIKWGDEIQTEVIANRIWIGLGGKFNDLNYANGPGAEGTKWQKNDGMVMVLQKEDAKKRAKEEGKGNCYAVTVDEFKACMKKFYDWAATPAILSHGVITEENFDAVLGKYLPTNFKSMDEYKAENLGATYITFRESGLEFKSKFSMKRGGAAAYSNVYATDDRMARGAVILNMWMGNRDAKDDNNKAYILSDFPGLGLTSKKTGNLYVETQHDLGYSFGRTLTAGEINELKAQDFIKGCSGGICFDEAMAYLPEAWKSATYSDALWMAKKVVTITAADLYEILSYTNWPQFMGMAFVTKMGKRQAGLASMFGLAPGITSSDFVNDYALDLTKGKELNTFLFDLSLSTEWSSLEASLKEQGNPNLAVLIKDGQLNDCADSKIMDFLQKSLFPSGLTQRMSRFVDGQEEVGCAAERANFGDVLKQ